MNNLPKVLVMSHGIKTPMEIIDNIRKCQVKDESYDLKDNLNGFKYNITTKYFEIDILLIPFNKTLKDIPLNICTNLEGLLIYFDADKREFLTSIKAYADFMKSNDIEFGVLLCKKLCDSEKDGITYAEAKKYSKLLDVIELEPENETEEESDDVNGSLSNLNPIGYDELIQTMRSFLWSNISISAEDKKLSGYNILTNNDELTSNDSNSEAELQCFEQLLTAIMSFRDNSSSLTRNDRLTQADQLATAFDDIIIDGISNNEDSSDEGSTSIINDNKI